MPAARRPIVTARGTPTLRSALQRALVVCLAAALVHAAPLLAEVSRVSALAAACATCHQPTQPIPPPLDTQSREALIDKLIGFRDGTRDGTVMPQLARGYTREELRALADYFAARAPAR